MKLITNYFNTMWTKPSNLFFINFFFLKNNLYFNIKYLLYIHLYLNIKNYLNIKILKFNYKFYNSVVLYYIILNIVLQLIILVIFY